MVGRNVKVRNIVVSICGAFHGAFVNTVLHEHGGKWRTHNYGLANDHVPPRCGHAILANANLDSMYMHGAIVAALDVIFPRPDKLDRRAAKTFRDHCSLTLHVGIGNGAPAKASARHLRVEGDLLRFQAEDFGDMAIWSTVWNCEPAHASARSPSKRMVVF